MLKNAVAVLDVGSSKVSAMIGERAVNNNIAIRSVCECEHEAFYDGQVERFSELKVASLNAVEGIFSSAKGAVDELYIGVPGEFIAIANRQYQIFFNRKKRIKEKDVNDLFTDAEKSVASDGYEIIDRSAVFYVVDGNTRVSDPIKQVSSSLSGYLTFYLCSKQFLTSMRNIFEGTRIKKLNFVPIPLAESLFLFDQQERFGYVVLVDVGYITTSLSIILGNGMLFHGAFPLSGGHITAYLMDKLKIDMSLAEKVKRKINLSINSKKESCYEVFVADERYTFSVSTCNKVVFGILDGIAEQIYKMLTDSQVRFPNGNNVVISLTGGGISYMRGAKEYLSSRLEMGVNTVAPNIPFLNKPDESSRLSLIGYALDKKK